MNVLKKVVVVVGKNALVFKGENLEVIDVGGSTLSKRLVIREKNKSAPENTIAVFNMWTYWREMGEDEEDPSSLRKVLIRPKNPVSSTTIRAVAQSLQKNQVVFIPHNFDILLVYENGDTKVL